MNRRNFLALTLGVATMARIEGCGGGGSGNSGGDGVNLERSVVPVQVQLLGGDPGRMAEAAVVAVKAGAKAIDINFGCPAPTVNRHDGGAAILRKQSASC